MTCVFGLTCVGIDDGTDYMRGALSRCKKKLGTVAKDPKIVFFWYIIKQMGLLDV